MLLLSCYVSAVPDEERLPVRVVVEKAGKETSDVGDNFHRSELHDDERPFTNGGQISFDRTPY